MTSTEHYHQPETDHTDNARRGSRTAAGPEYKRSLLNDPRKRALAAAQLDVRREHYEGLAGNESSAESAISGVTADMLGDLVNELRS
jgi:hypothetical protein